MKKKEKEEGRRRRKKKGKDCEEKRNKKSAATAKRTLRQLQQQSFPAVMTHEKTNRVEREEKNDKSRRTTDRYEDSSIKN